MNKSINKMSTQLFKMCNKGKGTLILFLLTLTVSAYAQRANEHSVYYPGETWAEITDLDAADWSREKLDAAQKFSNTLNTAAVVIVHKGKIVRKWGNINRKYKCHSIRKSFLSAMYGPEVKRGKIKLNATLKELDIDDNEPSLTPEEKNATVRMLLKARSGVYHDALYETKSMAAARPERHSHPPGTYWYYNNWDFNTLGTIYRQETGKDIYKSFKKMIADPIGMKNFNPQTDGEYYEGEDSIHPAYPFEMNAMDMARFGLLMERNGKWEDQQVIPEFWIKQSTVSYSEAAKAGYATDSGGYGYLWWVAVDGKHFGNKDEKVPYGLFTARGSGGHVIAIIPDFDLVVVHRVNTYKDDNRVPYKKFGLLLEDILLANSNFATPDT